jgi:hypothetical protein
VQRLLPRVVPVPALNAVQAGAVLVLYDVTDLVRLDEMRSELVAVASHELQTTLRMTLLMLQEASDRLPDRQRELVATSLIGVEQLSETVHEFLDLTRIEAGELRLNLEPVHVSAVIADALRRVQGQADARGISVHTRADLRLPSISADPVRLRAVFDNVLDTAQEAAIGFVRQLGTADVATVIDFDSRVHTAQDFTSETGALENAIRATRAGGSTSLHNALYIALKQLGKLTPLDDPGDPRRRAIVVLSDGEDTSSLVSFDEVFDLASRSDTVIYAIGLGANDLLSSRRGNDGVFLLRRLTQQTGGRAFFPKAAADLANVYSDIRNELASQYVLAYESGGARDGRWRRIAVRVTRPNVAVRTRQGYFASRR